MTLRVTTAVLLAALTVSCGDGEGPAGPVGPDGFPLGSLDEICDGALTGQDVLDTVQDEYSTVLDYVERPETTALTVHTAYGGGRITCLPHVTGPPGPDIAARVQVEIDMEFTTADGLFRERFTATLESAGLASSFSTCLAPDGLGGSFDPDMPEHENVRVCFAGMLEPADLWGSISKGGRIPGRASESIPVARW